MRVKRLKSCKRNVSFFVSTYGFRKPFQVLIDLTFCQFALTYKINIKEQIAKYIEGETMLYTTSCILKEGKSLGPQLHGAGLVCKQYKLRKCNHKKAVSAQECILSLIGEDNKDHFFVASQDKELRNQLRHVPGVPLLHIHYNALVLEKPSRNTIKQADQIDLQKTSITSDYEKSRLKDLQEKSLPKNEKPKRRKIKGVNPLAMKKKKVGKILQNTSDISKKRRRNKVKIATHVIEELKARTS